MQLGKQVPCKGRPPGRIIERTHKEYPVAVLLKQSILAILRLRDR
jgi:hypothetical protein